MMFINSKLKSRVVPIMMLALLLSPAIFAQEGEIEPNIKKLKSNFVAKQEKAAIELIKIGEPALPSIIEVLKDKKWYARRAAAFTLGEIKSKRAVSALVAALNDKDKRVRSQVAVSLGRIGDKTAVEPLIVRLQKEKKKWCRKYIVEALGKIGDPVVVPVLVKYFEDGDKDKNARCAAVYALRHIKDESALSCIKSALNDENTDVRYEAAVALGMFDDKNLLPFLREAFEKESDSKVRSGINWSIKLLEQRRKNEKGN